MTTTTMTGTGTKNEERARRCPRRSLLTHWGVGGGCTRHYPELQSSYKMHFHLSTYLRMRPVSRGLFRSAPNAGRCALFSIDRKLISTLSFAKRKKKSTNERYLLYTAFRFRVHIALSRYSCGIHASDDAQLETIKRVDR